ncbi:serine/threonine-protein kinase pim-2-like [Salvelinus fontinalis]|uniref:serine/threonine-protein kinase pim-2-like n=1 Tax=Salvelinus fontinalis TaxID=8038 RepID=UPI00248516C3|nr:serine/threonine-protein kinase pim-2-like [Salvelinus fontinalis]
MARRSVRSLTTGKDLDTHISPLANEGGANEGLSRLRDERAERRRRKRRSSEKSTGGRGERKRRGRSSERSTGGRGERKRRGRSEKDEEEGNLSLENIFGSSSMSSTTLVNTLQPPQCNSREPSPDPVAERFVQLGCLGDGGYGTVYAGYRRDDNLPVAIKRVPLAKVLRVPVTQNGQQAEFPLEVVLLRIVGGRGEARGEGKGEVVPPPRAAVALLDWFELDQELVLVLERPVPCMDLYAYIQMRGGTLQEEHARVILRQLVEAMREVHSRGVLHRDIKPENVLVETGSTSPRIRVLDFGCGCILRDGPYTECYGTSQYTPPEWFLRESYRAGPSTVWQLGVVLYDMLCGDQPFNTRREILYEEPYIKDQLSRHCVDLLRKCLAKRPRGRPTLEEMLLHPWLQPDTPPGSSEPDTPPGQTCSLSPEHNTTQPDINNRFLKHFF